MKEYRMFNRIVSVRDLRDEEHELEPESIVNSIAEHTWQLRETKITKLNDEELLFTFVVERDYVNPDITPNQT